LSCCRYAKWRRRKQNWIQLTLRNCLFFFRFYCGHQFWCLHPLWQHRNDSIDSTSWRNNRSSQRRW
jgi:hypothetical protein